MWQHCFLGQQIKTFVFVLYVIMVINIRLFGSLTDAGVGLYLARAN